MATHSTWRFSPRSARVTLGLILPLSAMLFSGCGLSGPTLIPVTGRVTLDGKPVVDAAVGFIPVKGGPMSDGMTDADGVFQLATTNKPGIPAGEYAVTVTKVHKTGYAKDGTVGPQGLRTIWHVPQRYSRRETSGLKAVVNSDEKELLFELSSRQGLASE